MTESDPLVSNDQPPISNASPDFLWPHLSALPAFRALLRAVEAKHYQARLPLEEPVLDVGCGDGHFASVAFPHSLDVGIDPAGGVLREAQSYGAYHLLAQAAGGSLPFADGRFGTVISNSVLEHIPDVDAVLSEIARVLALGKRFIFCVPSDHFTELLFFTQLFQRLGLQGLARAYSRYFNRISRHFHCDGLLPWKERLEDVGLHIVDDFYYFSQRAHHALDLGHYAGIPNLVVKKISGRWVLFPTRWNPVLALTERVLRSRYEEPLPHPGAYLFVVAEKHGTQ